MNTSIQNILDVLTNPTISIKSTVDKLLFGNPYTNVTAVAVTFLATQEVIEKAKTLGVNLIISHEGIFYSHNDNQKELQTNSVYKSKYTTIEHSGIAIFRYHDYIHKFIPDGITAGLLKTLEWQKYEIENLQFASILEIPPTTVQDLIIHIKKHLEIEHIRFMGNLSMKCIRVGLLVGYRGNKDLAISIFENKNLDIVIYGEGPEWETPEYVRDSLYQGKEKALIVLGHAESEMPGMEYLANRLQKKFPSIPIYFIPQEPVFKII